MVCSTWYRRCCIVDPHQLGQESLSFIKLFPSWSSGQDLSLSPTRPGFDPRTGNSSFAPQSFASTYVLHLYSQIKEIWRHIYLLVCLFGGGEGRPPFPLVPDWNDGGLTIQSITIQRWIGRIARMGNVAESTTIVDPPQTLSTISWNKTDHFAAF